VKHAFSPSFAFTVPSSISPGLPLAGNSYCGLLALQRSGSWGCVLFTFGQFVVFYVIGMLAEMIGTSCSRVNLFMNKFRQLGFIEYNGGIKINKSLLTVVLHD